MSDLRKAAQQALEALEGDYRHAVRDDAIDALRAALAQPEQFQPDRDRIEALEASLREHMAEIHRLKAQPEPEPDESVIFYRCKGCAYAYESTCPTSCNCMSESGFLKVKYFTHQSKHKPLMEDEIQRVCVNAWSFDPYEIARAIERAHGIGAQP